MSADHNNLLGMLAAGNFADDIGGVHRAFVTLFCTFIFSRTVLPRSR